MNEFTKNEPHWSGSVRDWTVVLWAYFCGKVLRCRNYLPQDVGNNTFAFQGLPRMTICRILLLIKLWGYRPLTLDEFDRLKENHRSHANCSKQAYHCRDHSRCLRIR